MMNHRAGQFLFALALLAAALLIYSCAQTGAPQGGPADLDPPTVDVTSPGSGDVLVDRSSGLILHFSEPLDRATLTGNVQISPARTGPAKYKWSAGGRRVEISWPDSLRDSTSYRVTVTNRVADRRGNKFLEPFTFAFSTGPQVDRGEIRGQIRTEGGKTGTYDVLAYRLETIVDTFMRTPPDYSTQSAPDGRFQLPFLRAGEYRLLILADGNRNLRPDHGERYALAPRDYAVADEAPPDSADYFPIAYDTVPFTLRSCAPISPGLIGLTFSHPLDTIDAVRWSLTVRDSATGEEQASAILNPTPRRTGIVTLHGSWNVGSVYRISVANVYDQRGHYLSADSCDCPFIAIQDTVGPRVEWVTLPTQTEALSPVDPIQWFFSEPVDTARFVDAITVRDTLGESLNGSLRWIDRQRLLYAPDPMWPETTVVIALLDSAKLADVSGNLAGAGTYMWRFTPLTEPQMGEIEGRVETERPGATSIIVTARSIGDARKTSIRATAPGSFSLALPAGRWQLGGYVQSEGDSRWFPGSLEPFRHAQPRTLQSDTLDVRARFVLEDVVLRF